MGVDPNMMPLALATLALMVPWLYDGSLLIKREQLLPTSRHRGVSP